MISAVRKAGLRMMSSPLGQYNKEDISEELTIQQTEILEYVKYCKTIVEADYFSDSYKTWVALHPELFMNDRVRPVTKTDPGPPVYFDKIWVLRSVTITNQTSTGAHHLIKTKWNQEYPWNQFCPIANFGDTTRCLAGCVAIAGAQQLYFLNRKYGYPANTYGFCTIFNDWGNHAYYYTFYDYSPHSWNRMAKNYRRQNGQIQNTDSVQVAATLISYVGDGVSMNYGPNVSLSSLGLLHSFLFNSEGITSQYAAYDKTTAWNYIHNNSTPIIVAGSTANAQYGHCWIMDGAKLTTTTRTYIYDLIDLVELQPEDLDDGEFAPILPRPTPLPTVYDTRTEVETTRSKTYTMNFGNNSSDDNIIFDIDDAWRLLDGTTFSVSKTMIYNFNY